MTNDLTEASRRAIFADLVAAQDEGAAVRDSRDMTARKHGVGVDDVRRIEQEGIDRQWPPL